MDKIVGKYRYIGFLLVLVHVGLHAKLVMEVTNINGNKVSQVAAGEPFLIKVSLDNADAAADMQIKGLRDFSVRKTGYSLITVNGEKTAQLTYQVQIDRPGSYSLGPAYSPSTKERSNSIRMSVEAEQVTQNRANRSHASSKKKNGDVQLRLWTDKDTVFVGEKVKTVLRLYFPESDDISVEQIITNDPDTIQVTEKIGPKKGVQEIDGTEYIFYEWQWDMYANQAGKLVIPAYFVDYNKQLPMHSGLGHFAIFFGPRYERKRVYSNALTLQVRALPDEQRKVDAVGNFLAYRAKIQPAVAKKYEGMVLRLSIEGDGNMISLKEPILQDMPETFKYYFSKSAVENRPFGQKKTFEYIVQGMQEGDWEIPEQTFAFFDVEGRTYKTLHTTPLFISILPGKASAPLPDVSGGEPVSIQDDIAPLIEYRLSDYPRNSVLSFWWFVFLLVMPLFSSLCYVLLYRSGWLVQKIAPHYIKQRAFKLAKKQLARAYRYHDTRLLYGIFMQLIAHRLSVAVAQLSSTEVNDIIAKSSWEHEKKHEWSVFFDKISQAAYAGAAGPKEVLRLFHEAAQWLAELERIV
ncbi:MAG: BatD family protein [Candidatus Dependentiae bacterium]